MLLDWYYSSEKPIPLALAYRIVQARSGPERRATDEVLTTCFDLCKAPGFAHNKRADIDIAKYQVKSAANTLIALERESTKRARNVDETCHELADSVQPSQEPVTNSHIKAKEAKASLSPNGDRPNCPHQEIVKLYHELMPANPRIKVWDGARADALRARWNEDEKRQTLDYWRRFLTHCAASAFLTGREHGANDRPFLPGLEWLVKAGNFAKVIEGRYHGGRA